MCLVGVFVIRPELRNVFWDVYALLALLIKVSIPVIFKLKFRFYLAVRYAVNALLIGVASLFFYAFSHTHPALILMVLVVTISEEIIVTAVWQRCPQINEYLDTLEPDFKLVGKTK